MVHFNTGEAPMAAKVVAFNRDVRTGRVRYTVRVRFEHQTWTVGKYYSDFLGLRNSLEHSQFFEVAGDLPPKHPLRLRLRMKLSLTKRHSLRKEMSFIRYRMRRLELWLNKVLAHVTPEGVQEVQFLNDFFEAFPEDESYHRSEERRSRADVGASMYHGLRSMAVPSGVYEALWHSGYCCESLRSMTVTQWLAFGVSPVLANALFHKFHVDDDGGDEAALGSRWAAEQPAATAPVAVEAPRWRSLSDAAAIAAVASVPVRHSDSALPPPSYSASTTAEQAKANADPGSSGGGGAAAALARPVPTAPPAAVADDGLGTSL